MTKRIEVSTTTKGAVLLRSGLDPEFELVDLLASLQGLKRATALKMHLRETLPAKLTKLEKESQQKSRGIRVQ